VFEQWAAVNNLRLNRDKCTDIFFVDPRRRHSVEPLPLLTGVKRVTMMKMLGVTVTNTLPVAEHVQAIIRACAPSIHALRVLRGHGLNDAALQTAYRAIIVARLTYASNAWWDFTTADDRQHIEGFLRRGVRAGFYLPSWPTVENLVEDAEDVLFIRVVNNENHVLCPLLPDRNLHGYELRHWCHDRIITSNDDKCNFIYRQIHKYSY